MLFLPWEANVDATFWHNWYSIIIYFDFFTFFTRFNIEVRQYSSQCNFNIHFTQTLRCKNEKICATL